MRWVTLPLQVRCGLMSQVESPLINPTVLPLLSAQAIATNKVLAIAPHPDDETLGCGGAIALLRSLGCQVRVLVISDGTMSHPRSRKYPPAALRALREAETLAATGVLGVDASEVTFLGLPDGGIPMLEDAQVKGAVSKCRATIATFAPDLIFLPWRYDPHPDHRATWQLIQTALFLEAGVQGRQKGQGDKETRRQGEQRSRGRIITYDLRLTTYDFLFASPN